MGFSDTTRIVLIGFSLFVMGLGCGTAECPPGTVLDAGRCILECTGDECEPPACTGDACEMFVCGDGVISEGEDCDDGNMVDGDACESDCTFACTTDAECDDGNSCNGIEMCSDMQCVEASAPADESACITEAGADGVCVAEMCAPAGCGNGVIEIGEACDDQNTDNDDGCKADCTFSCTADVECDNEDVCDGTEVCNMETHACTPGVVLACDDEETCTADSCDPTSGCAHELIDEDGDGYSSLTCDGAEFQGGDCADHEATAYPGAAARSTGYCPDAATCSADERVFDYDCDGDDVASFTAAGSTACIEHFSTGTDAWGRPVIRVTCSGGGWAQATAPICGLEGNFRTCTRAGGRCTDATAPKTQTCR